jgi:hypothetical protein
MTVGQLREVLFRFHQLAHYNMIFYNQSQSGVNRLNLREW